MSGTAHLPLPCLECLSEANSHSPFLLTCGVLGLGATKGPGPLNVCSFPSCFTVAVGQCSEQVSLEVYGQEVWESADMIWSDMKGPARPAGPLPSSLPSSIFYQDSLLLLSSRIARWGSRMKEATHQGWQMEHSKELVPPMGNRPPLGKPFYLVFCCKQLNLLWLLDVFFPTLKMKTKNCMVGSVSSFGMQLKMSPTKRSSLALHLKQLFVSRSRDVTVSLPSSHQYRYLELPCSFTYFLVLSVSLSTQLSSLRIST